MNEKTVEAVEQMLKSCLKPEVVMDVKCSSDSQCADVLSLNGAAKVVELPSKLRSAIPDLMFDMNSVVTEKWIGSGKVGHSTRVTFTGTQTYKFFPMFPVGERFSGEVHWEVLKRMDGAAIHYNWNFCASQAAVKLVKELPMLPLGSVTANVMSLSLQDIVTPDTTPRYEAAAEWAGDNVSEHSHDTTELNSPAFAVQPVLFGMASMFVPAPFPQSQPVTDNYAIELQQEAQRAELAAAAIRAQIKLEAAERQSQASHHDHGTGMTQQRQRKVKKQTSRPAQPTSVMLRNLPLDLDRDMFLEMLNREGFMGDYDIIYLPRDFRTGANLGYAFVNLLTHDAAVRMQRQFTGFHRWSCRSAKKCEAAWSSHQGLAEYIDRYRNNPVMHESVPDDFKPAFFRKGIRVEFPPPTRTLRSPQDCL
jgi:hypothetical protein